MPDADDDAQPDSAESLQSSQKDATTPEAEQANEEHAPTPFDHPLFLPVLLSGLTLWFGYDGWLNTDEKMQEHLTFNRVGFGVLLLGAIYTGINGYKEWKEDQQ
jgi:hypothetical protein